MSVLGGNPLLMTPEGYQISRSVRLRSSASAYFNRTFASTPTTWTFSAWVKRGSLGAAQNIVGVRYVSGGATGYVVFTSADQLAVALNGTVYYTSTAVYRDPSAWYHVVLQVTPSAASFLYVNGIQVGTWTSPASPILFNSTANYVNTIGRYGDSATQYFDGYLTEINFIDGQPLTPSSFGETDAVTGVWKPKKYTGTYGTNGFYLPFSDNSSTTALGYDFNSQGVAGASFTTGGTALSSSDDASYPKAYAFDGITTNANAWRSGELSPGVSGVSYIGYDCGVGVTKTPAKLRIMQGRIDAAGNGAATSAKVQYSSNGSSWTDLQTLTLDATSGTETTWQVFTINGASAYRYWRLLANSNTSGTGQRWAVTELEFLEAGSCGFNRWTPNNISVTAGVTYDSMLDTPTPYADGGNGRGNYAVLNPLWKGANITPTDGNLTNPLNVGSPNAAMSTMPMSKGKWYAEMTNTGSYASVGLCILAANLTAPTFTIGVTAQTGLWELYDNGAGVYRTSDGGAFSGSLGASRFLTAGTIQFAYDADAGKFWIGRNNTWYDSSLGTTGDPSTGANPTFTIDATRGPFNIAAGSNSLTNAQYWNFGQRSFSYTPPTGFLALNTQNLPDSTIKKGNQYFDVSLYTGNGTSQSIVNSGGFQPDLVWVKERSGTRNHRLVDSVRGVGKEIYSDLTFAEATDAAGLTSFNSNGYSIGSSVGYNASGITEVGWQWKKGATQGFDIVTYTGDGTTPRAISHALGAVPNLIITHKRSSGGTANRNWPVRHKAVTDAFGNNECMFLNLTNSRATQPQIYTSAPTPSVYYVGSDTEINENAQTYVAYLFSEVLGFSKFGSYTGNGAADGPFVYCGFRPRYLLVKASSGTSAGSSNWIVWDSARDTYNKMTNYLMPNSSGIEATGPDIDFTANGFKLRNSGTGTNESSTTYIFAAFAENPTKYSLAR